MADTVRRSSMLAVNPDFTPKEMMGAMAKKWKTLSSEEKAAYQPDPSSSPVTSPKKKKRAPSAYNRFMADPAQREALKTENPEFSPKEMMGAMAKKWKSLSSEEKTAYQPEHSSSPGTSPKKKKRAPSAYNRFMADADRRTAIKTAHPESSPREIMSLMASEWKTLSDEDKAQYQ